MHLTCLGVHFPCRGDQSALEIPSGRVGQTDFQWTNCTIVFVTNRCQSGQRVSLIWKRFLGAQHAVSIWKAIGWPSLDLGTENVARRVCNVLAWA